MKMNKLIIKNIHNTEGMNIEGVSIDNWITNPDAYEFMAYVDGHKWLYKLWRDSIDVTLADETDPKKRYRLELHAVGSRCYTKYLGTNEIKIKRLFYKSIKGLVNEHMEYITNQILTKAFAQTSVSHSINI